MTGEPHDQVPEAKKKSTGAEGTQGRGLSFEDYASHDAVGLAERVRRRELGAAEILEAAIARTEVVNPTLNAVVAKHYELARDAVRAGLPAGPLAGVPMLLKDLEMDIAGTVTSCGSRFFRDAVAAHDSTLVERYRAAGLVIFGKTATPELGQTATTESRLWGQTRNPWNLDYSTGGSSGGSAAAVAAGIVPAAAANDGGGSIRIPAAHCGLFGLKPSRGRVPLGPVALEGWMGLVVAHVISRSVRDSAALLDASRGPEPGSRVIPQQSSQPYLEQMRQAPRRLRIALWDSHPFGMLLHEDCRAAVMHAARVCESLGHHVEPASPDLPVADMFGAYGVIVVNGVLNAIRSREKVLGRAVTEDDVEQVTWHNLQVALSCSAEQLFAAHGTLAQVARMLDQFLERFDVILSPVTAASVPRLGVLTLDQPYGPFSEVAVDASVFTTPFNVGGHPAMSVPLHWNAQNLPIGVQFATRFGDELTLLQLAAELEQAAPWGGRRPSAP